MKRWVIGIVALAVLVAAGWSWFAFTSPAEETVPRTTPVTRATVEETVLASGVIQAKSLVSVGAEVSGRIKALNVSLGDEVTEGDVIAEIDSLNQENEVRAAQASLDNVKAQQTIQQATLKQAQTSLERARKLQPQELISDVDFQAAELAVESAMGQLQAIAAQIEQAEINVDTAQLNLDRTRILAPAGGTVVAVLVDVGQSVNANTASPTIVKIANLDQMVVKAEISEADVPRVEAGQKVYFTILGDPDTQIDATLRAIEPAPESIATEDGASSASGSAIYYNGLFDVENPDHRLRISMTAQVTIVLNAAEDVLTVPATVLSQRGRDGAYTVSVWSPESGAIERRPVEIGLNNKILAEVESGLSEGDLVVTGTAGGATGAGGGRGGNNPLGGGFGGRGPRF